MNAILFGALFGFLGVAAGAFGAHGLKTRISSEMLAIFQTGVFYQLIHALLLLAYGILRILRPQIPSWIAWVLVLGIILFSGSLYALALGGARQFGMITPLGGLAFLVAWIAIFWVSLRRL